MVTIISLGGSIVAPAAVDTDFVGRFVAAMGNYLEEDASRRLVLIVGGGAPAREYQKAYREISGGDASDAQDWIGIMATRLNAELVRAVFGTWCENAVVTDPSAEFEFSGRVLVAAGWKPGFSTDFDAVVLAERFNARRLINLSNIVKIYTADPRLDPDARPLDNISWEDYSAMAGDEWVPGRNLPFDPVATRRGRELGLEVISAAGAISPIS